MTAPVPGANCTIDELMVVTLAREFIGEPFRVCLLESGGLEFEPATQALYQGETIGLPYPLDTTRLRYFGGTTNHWSGWCRPLDETDFEKRDWIQDTIFYNADGPLLLDHKQSTASITSMCQVHGFC